MEIHSPAFGNFEAIPKKYSCDGEEISPPLQFADVPDDARSLVLVVEDPDASGGAFIHWVMWNIEPSIQRIPEGTVPETAIEGINSAGLQRWSGPCPPHGQEHRYMFHLYALNNLLELRSDAPLDDIRHRLEEFLITENELVGYYRR